MNRPGEGSNPSSPPSDTSNDMKVAFSTGPWYPLRPDALREGFDGGQELENGVFVRESQCRLGQERAVV